MRKYSPFLFLVFLFACELIVDVDVPFKQPQLVLNSFFNPDSVWTASINLNRHILSDLTYKSVDDAMVIVYQNNSPLDTLIHQHDGFYKAKANKPLLGIEYEIRASAANYEAISGRSLIPNPAQITNVEVKKGSMPDDFNSVISVTFKDNGSETNYYQINVESEREWYDYTEDKIYTIRYPVYIEGNDLIAENENTYWGEGIIVKDILFNGKEVTLSFTTTYWDIENSGAILVSLQTLSEDSYKYKATAELQNETSGDPFAQPVNVSSNIENGFGIFAGYSQSTFVLSNPKPIILGISPSKGKAGDYVIISGENLQGGSVSFRANEYQAYASTVSSSENAIEVIVPENATTGKFIVYTNSGVVMSDFDFEVVN